MGISRFFVGRPIFAWVIAIGIMLAGIAGLTSLPVAQYPDVAPPTIQVNATYPGASAETLETSVTQIMPWRTLVGDIRLRAVIEQALSRNQDLAAAVANAASARAQYRTQRSYQLPTVTAEGGASIQRGLGGSSTSNSTQFSADAGVSGFELDLFGRLKNLSREAFEKYLASESGARSTKFTIVSETAQAYLTLAADQDLLTTARAQVVSSQRTVDLTNRLHDVGLVGGSDVSDATTTLAQAKSDVASHTTQIAQDRNALELLTGGPVADALLPTSLASLDGGIANVPAGLSSAVLLDRPDVVEAEHQLKGAVASIGAARAAFFPTISMTSAIGVASTALRTLFSGSSAIWSASPSVSLPVSGGTNRGNLAYAKAQADYYLALYRKAAQTAYKDVADGLARRGTIVTHRAAQDQLVGAASKSEAIADARYRAGADSFLAVLVAQRTLYSARQSAISVMLTDLTNRVTLYQAIGSDDTL